MCIFMFIKKIKTRGPGPYAFLRHTDHRKYFSGLSL